MSVVLNLNQARELLEFFGGEDASVTVSKLHNHAHSGPGVYAWLTEHPEEGSIKLDEEPQPTDGVPAFDPTQPCALTPEGAKKLGPVTECPRCKNPHHKCDHGTPGVTTVQGPKPFAHCDCPDCDAAGVMGKENDRA